MTTIGISVDVENVDRAITFYREGLGLKLIERGDGWGGWATMALGNQTFFFGIPWGPEGPLSRDHAHHWTPVHLDFVVDDFDAAVQRALNAGAKLDRPIVRRKDRGDMANMFDPSGNGFDIIQRTSSHKRERAAVRSTSKRRRRKSQ
jgi:predicted enzyme related to lactoylglutathione lyase